MSSMPNHANNEFDFREFFIFKWARIGDALLVGDQNMLKTIEEEICNVRQSEDVRPSDLALYRSLDYAIAVRHLLKVESASESQAQDANLSPTEWFQLINTTLDAGSQLPQWKQILSAVGRQIQEALLQAVANGDADFVQQVLFHVVSFHEWASAGRLADMGSHRPEEDVFDEVAYHVIGEEMNRVQGQTIGDVILERLRAGARAHDHKTVSGMLGTAIDENNRFWCEAVKETNAYIAWRKALTSPVTTLTEREWV